MIPPAGYPHGSVAARLVNAPELVVEILSGSTASHDRGEKKAFYEHNGVCEYWVIDPRQRDVTRFVSDGSRFDTGRVFAENDRLESVVFAKLVLDVRSLFP
jgi:Uma2 family endonuclease